MGKNNRLITIIVPVHSESGAIGDTLGKISGAMGNFGEYAYEIIVADDGPKHVVIEEAKKSPTAANGKGGKKKGKIRFLSFREKTGKGGVISAAINRAKGGIALFMDSDLATDLSHIPEFIRECETHDIAVGSRLVQGANVQRFFHRGLASRIYNFAVRSLFGSAVHDHQCGFKAFKTRKIKRLLPFVKNRHWLWDTELLILAQRSGYSISEVPVEWQEKEGGTFNLLTDGLSMGIGLIRYYFELRSGKPQMSKGQAKAVADGT